MSAPAPEFPEAAASTTTFSFGGYASEPTGLAGVSFWPRVGARLIDLAVHYCVSFAAGIFFTILLAAASGGHIPVWVLVKLRNLGATGFVFSLLGSFAYQVVCLAVHGSTLGKRTLGMVVVQEDGTPCRLWPAIIRELGYFVDALFFGLIGYLAMQKTLKEQRHGDEWAHTVVCKRSAVAPEQLRGAGRFVLAVMLATMADVALTMVGLLVVINS
jgi:uncharacterized RDD family membrane protein YckC